jgi:hypothetical protein
MASHSPSLLSGESSGYTVKTSRYEGLLPITGVEQGLTNGNIVCPFNINLEWYKPGCGQREG